MARLVGALWKEHQLKSNLARAVGAFALGLGLAVSAWAQPVEGEVIRVDQDAGKVTLKHGEIKNLDMPAMQMSFRVANPAWLKTLQVHDKVRFSADKVDGQFTVTALEVKK